MIDQLLLPCKFYGSDMWRIYFPYLPVATIYRWNSYAITVLSLSQVNLRMKCYVYDMTTRLKSVIAIVMQKLDQIEEQDNATWNHVHQSKLENFPCRIYKNKTCYFQYCLNSQEMPTQQYSTCWRTTFCCVYHKMCLNFWSVIQYSKCDVIKQNKLKVTNINL